MNADKNSTINTSFIFTSILVGLYIDIKCINWALVYGFFSGRENGFMSVLYPITILMILMIYVTTGIRKNIEKSIYNCLLAIFLVFFYALTYAFIGEPRVSISFFALFTLSGLLISNYVRVDGRILLLSIMFWPCFAITRLDKVFVMALDWVDVISMDASYAFMPPIIATIIYCSFYFKREKGFVKLFALTLTLINFVYFLRLFQYGSRGPLLSIFSTIFFLTVCKKKDGLSGILIDLKRLFLIVTIILISIFLMNALFGYLLNILDELGLQSRAIEKILRLSFEGDISNGRESLQTMAIDGFLKKIVFGNGLDRFDANTGGAYPHNFIIQILYDGGIVLFFVLLVPMIKGVVSIYKRCNSNQYVVYTLLMFSSVPYALLSLDMWENAVLWLFIGAIFSKTFVLSSDNTIK